MASQAKGAIIRWMALTVIEVDGRRIMCSTLDSDELHRLYAETRKRGVFIDVEERGESKPLELGLVTIGPVKIDLGSLELILWGTHKELRYYTPEEFSVVFGEESD